MNAGAAVKDILVAASVGGFNATTGWSIVMYKLVDLPDTCIAVNVSGGESPNPAFLLDFPAVQVMVRGAIGDADNAYAKAIACKNALLGVPSQNFADGRLDSLTLLGDINSLGWDAKDRPLFSINCRLITEPSAGTNRSAL